MSSLNVANKTHYNPSLEQLGRGVFEQKLKFEEAKKNYQNLAINAINFNRKSNSQLITNDPHVGNYNTLRKSATTFHTYLNKRPKKKTEIYDSLNSYELNGDIFDLKSNRSNYSNNSSKTANYNNSQQILKLNRNTYRGADGTTYRHYETDTHYIQETDYPTKNVIHIPGRYHELYRQTLTAKEVPTNIRHKFGTKDTTQLLDDQLKVHDTLSKIYNSGIIKQHQKPEPVNQEKIIEKKNNEIQQYYDLGNHLRFAICHGYPEAIKKNQSSNEKVHNELVSKEYLSDIKNIESPFRRKRDWLSTWMEHNVVRSRIEAGLTQRAMEQSKKSQPN